MIGFGRGIIPFLRRFGRSQNGNVAMMAGIALPVLLMISAGAIDLHHIAKVRGELQDALDAATLAAARSNSASVTEVNEIGMASLRANMPDYFKSNPADTASFSLSNKYQVEATATVQVKTIVANIFLPPYGQLFDDYMPLSATSEVLRASRHVEVAMALDVTGSMGTPKNYMPDLKAAAKELVSIVVQGDQTLFTTRIALVPYAGGVNMDIYADDVRGALKGPTNITAVDLWAAGSKNVSSMSTSGEFSVTNHGLGVNDYVRLDGFSNSSVNGSVRKVTSVSSGKFKLEGISQSYSAGQNATRTVRKCTYANCRALITSSNHGLATDDYVLLQDISGASDINNVARVEKIDSNRFYAAVSVRTSQSPGSTGKAYCGADGCRKRIFVNMQGSIQALDSSTCISERPRGSQTPNDSVPGAGNWVGRSYLESTNACPSARFIPLTNDDILLNATIDSYTAGGSTAGQTGIEMAWYALSPTFGSFLPETRRAYAYDPSQTVKAIILMTDGEFNTPYCQGVVAKDAGPSSGNSWAKINCNATNGNGFKQSVDLCKEMKRQGAVVYTIGFNLSTNTGGYGVDTAYEVMQTCATSSGHFFPASDGTDLKEAFKSIGRDITRLRIAR